MAAITASEFRDKLRGLFGSSEDSTGGLKTQVDQIKQHTKSYDVPTDADGDFTVIYLDRFDRDITITAASFLTAGTITADATNYTTLKLNVYDGAGGAATLAASRATDTVTTDDVAAGVPWALVNSGTAANLNVDSGEVIGVVGTKAAAGVTVPAGKLVVVWEER